MLELYRLTLFAGFIAQKKKPIGSKRWLKTWRNWNFTTGLHRFAVQHFIVCKASIFELFTSKQCRNRRQLRSSDSKQPKTRILNKAIKRQTWMKMRFAVLNPWASWHLRPVQLNPAALLDTRKAVTQLQRPLAPTGLKKSVAVLRCSRGLY